MLDYPRVCVCFFALWNVQSNCGGAKPPNSTVFSILQWNHCHWDINLPTFFSMTSWSFFFHNALCVFKHTGEFSLIPALQEIVFFFLFFFSGAPLPMCISKRGEIQKPLVNKQSLLEHAPLSSKMFQDVPRYRCRRCPAIFDDNDDTSRYYHEKLHDDSCSSHSTAMFCCWNLHDFRRCWRAGWAKRRASIPWASQMPCRSTGCAKPSLGWGEMNGIFRGLICWFVFFFHVLGIWFSIDYIGF